MIWINYQCNIIKETNGICFCEMLVSFICYVFLMYTIKFVIFKIIWILIDYDLYLHKIPFYIYLCVSIRQFLTYFVLDFFY